MTWQSFIVGVIVAAVCLTVANRREELNKIRYTVACSTKSDSLRSFMKGFTEGLK